MDRAQLARLVSAARSARASERGAQAARELFRALRTLFATMP
jgi:ribosomal 50S subunit-associated protein YjgA (DUF615 family)